MLPLFAAASVAALAGVALAQDDPVAATPLTAKHFTWGSLPYQVDTDPTGRGPQSGYNLCNSTTLGPTSQCQTLVINSVEDFCLWGPPTPNSDVGTTEAASVAWCTTNKYGTRVIPDGALTAVQFIKTPSYIQVTGWLQQSLIDMDPNDGGGEMDPHGADERGNPLGALVFSDNLPQSNANGNTNFVQVIEWHNFMGSNMFCFKACDPMDPNAANYCQHVFDRIGCQYNAPAAYTDGLFESCLGDNQDFPGVYTGANGVVSTYVQPAESLGPITTIPYTARIPASSSCTTYQSSAIYSSQPLPSVPLTMPDSPSGIGPSGTAASTTAKATNAVASAAAGSKSSSSASAKSSASGSTNAGQSVTLGMGGAWTVAVGVVGAVVGAVAVF